MSHETASAAETPQPEAERVPTLEELEGTRAPKNSVVGVVVGTAMQKTIMVKVSTHRAPPVCSGCAAQG
jgi:hypothetical protein